MTEALGQDSLVQLRLGHLGMIQDVVTRLAGYSATVKNFCITVVAGAIVATYAGNKADLLWIAVIAVILFAALDAYYLALERSFRAFYDKVADRPLAQASNLTIRRGSFSWPRALWSASVLPFYFPQVVVVAVLMLYKL